jgi:transcription initiation factor TFIIE subunit beta
MVPSRHNGANKQDAKEDTFRYLFKLKLNNKADLSRLLYEARLEHGYDFKELQESWPDVKNAVEELEKEGKCMIMKGSQDRITRVFWNDPVLVTPMDPALVKMWESIRAPDDVESELNKSGLKGVQVAPKEKQTEVKKKRKQGARHMKITNTHLAEMGIDLSKDYQFPGK